MDRDRDLRAKHDLALEALDALYAEPEDLRDVQQITEFLRHVVVFHAAMSQRGLWCACPIDIDRRSH